MQEPLFANLEPSDKRTREENVGLVEDLRWESAAKGLWPFAQNKPCVVGRTLRVPQMFTEFSPAIFGVEAGNILTQLPLELGGNFFLSSPKRYLWDQDMLGHLGVTGMSYWTMSLNRWHPGFDHYANRHIVYELGGRCAVFWMKTARTGAWTRVPLPTSGRRSPLGLPPRPKLPLTRARTA